MTDRPAHFAHPRTPLVALEGGPKHRRWLFYADWLALRAASRRGRYPIDHPCASERRYLPTDRHATNTNPAITDRHGEARIWEHVPPATWRHWDREYLTPEETSAADGADHDHQRREAA
ncbi:hypothetical protein [Saccharothrix hoggarensis]|uniref:Uncharacterized protein n=1 Tax=Saccharothrix hoggarensis TaxID=913853 RepID=A0ABW3R312_9PSEU